MTLDPVSQPPGAAGRRRPDVGSDPARRTAVDQFEPLIGEWHGKGEVPSDPPMPISQRVTIERLGAFVVFRTAGQPAELPDSIAIIGGGSPRDPQPMHYFDSRGVKRMFVTAVAGVGLDIWGGARGGWG